MASENIKERKIYRVLTDEANKIWERIYFLTNARSVDADDGNNLETKVGAIKGITTSTTVTEEGWAADAKMVNEKINELKKFVADGKALVASALTLQGVNTSPDASFDTIKNNINIACNNKYNQGKAEAVQQITVRAEAESLCEHSTGGTRLNYARPYINEVYKINSNKTVTKISSTSGNNDEGSNKTQSISIRVTAM